MTALKGALSVILLMTMFRLVPLETDAAFFALSVPLRILILVALSLMGFSGLMLFLWGIDDQYGSKPPPAERGPAHD